MTTLTRDKVLDTLLDTHGGFFNVVFVKRTTGETRKMLATLNIKSALKGGQAKYDHKAKNLLVVRDVAKTKEGVAPIRSIPLENVLEITTNGVSYTIVD